MTPRPFLLLVLAAAGLIAAAPARAVEPGDLLVASRLGGIYVVNPQTGAQVRLSDPINGEGFKGVVSDANGNIYAVSVGVNGPAAVVKIDAATGGQTPLSSGGELAHPFSIAIAPDGDLLVCDPDAFSATGALFRIDPVSGERTAFVRNRRFWCVAVTPGGEAYAINNVPGTFTLRLDRVDLATGALTLVPSGPFQDVRGLAVDGLGNLLGTDRSPATVFSIVPATGARSPIATGFPLTTPWDLAVEDTGTIVVVDNQHSPGCFSPPFLVCRSALLRIDPATGMQSIISQEQLADAVGVDIYRGASTTPARPTSWGAVKAIYR